MRRLPILVRPALIVATAVLGLATCKLSLTPDTVKNTYDSVKDAQKDLTPENEYYVGRAVATNLLAKHDYKYADADALGDGRLEGQTAYINRVGNLIAYAAMETTRDGDRPSPIAGWHFTIIESDTINAFAAPGGYIFVTTAALAAAKNEDELAAILAHEVAHVVRGHALGSIKKSRWAGVAKEALDSSVELDEKALGDLTKSFEGALDDIVDSVLVKGYSRDTEFEADKIGAAIMASAGYNPKAFTRYLKKLKKSQNTGTGGMSATHPSAGDRISELKGHIKKLPKHEIAAARTERFAAAFPE